MEVSSKTPKKKPSKLEDMTKEQIRQAIVKKRECNAKAQKIVEGLLEKNITDEYFLKCLPDINQSHFTDIIEERAIVQLCGYPLCEKTLSVKDIPKQQYRISMKTNKVYDITARKHFCSNSCYKSAMYVQQQMLTSPLWFREYEEIPKFQLLPSEKVGSLGQEVDVSIVPRIKVKSAQTPFTSINDFTSASLNDMSSATSNETTDQEKQILTQDKTLSEISIKSTVSVNESSKENKLNNSNEIVPIAKEITSNIIESSIKTPTQKKVSNPLNIVGEIVERPERTIDPILTSALETDKSNIQPENKANKISNKKALAVTVLTIEVEKCLAQWFSLDTLIILLGEEKVREMVSDKGDCIKEYLNNYSKGILYSSNTYDQYQALCRKLNMLELEDRKSDSQILQKEMKPLPDYSIIQEESKKMQLKVKAFLSGDSVVPNVESTPATSIAQDENLTQVPLVDKNAQNALRRRIVCQHLNKVLPDLLRSLGLLTLSISSDVRLLVNSFKLKADNIMFKPIQWTLLAIVVIKLLSLRDQRLEYMLEQPKAFQHMQLLLLSYQQDGGYLDRLVSWLTDIDRLLDNNDTQLTIE